MHGKRIFRDASVDGDLCDVWARSISAGEEEDEGGGEEEVSRRFAAERKKGGFRLI